MEKQQIVGLIILGFGFFITLSLGFLHFKMKSKNESSILRNKNNAPETIFDFFKKNILLFFSLVGFVIMFVGLMTFINQ